MCRKPYAALELQDKLAIAVKALEEIKNTQGKVCEEFEICKHIACQSSCGSWMIADKALKDIEEYFSNL